MILPITKEPMNYEPFFKLFFLSGFCLVSLLGCVTQLRIYDGAPLQIESVNQIQNGKTTKTEILEWFGPPVAFEDPKSVLGTVIRRYLPPSYTVKANPEQIFAYEYRVAKGFNFFLFFWIYSYLDTRSDYLLVFFDEENRVTEHSLAEDWEHE